MKNEKLIISLSVISEQLVSHITFNLVLTTYTNTSKSYQPTANGYQLKNV